MNIIEACRLLDKFGGYITKRNFINDLFEDKIGIWITEAPNETLCNLSWDGIAEPLEVDASWLIDDNWVYAKTLYKNNSFEEICCKICNKLLNDMEGLAPVCECTTGVKIGDTVKVTAKDIAMMHSIKCQRCEKYKKSPSDNVGWCECNKFDGENIDWQILDDGYIGRDLNDDVLLYEFIKDCQIDGVLHRAGERVLWKKSKAKFIEDGGIIEIASNNPYWPPRVSAQYPGMIEVNYLDKTKIVTNYESIILRRYLKEAPFTNEMIDNECPQRYEYSYEVFISSGPCGHISEKEYHRILNLFKASGLEVSE